jgi:pyruvate dehydrogenase E2 component (dihydrolipoamide acetyltransferase)
MAIEVYMPKMSDHMESGEIIEWLVSEGGQVEEGQPIIEVMTDKVTAEIEAPASGILRGIRRGAVRGAEVPVGETIAYIAEKDEGVPELPPLRGGGGRASSGDTPVSGFAAAGEKPKYRVTVANLPQCTGKPGVDAVPGIDATPVALRTAEKHGIDISEVKGSGTGGKIQKHDVLAMVERQKVQAVPPERVKASPAARRRAKKLGVDLSLLHGTGLDGIVRESDVDLFYNEQGAGAAGAAEFIELTSIQKITGERMSFSASTAPQFTLSVRAEVEKLMCIRDIMMDRVEAESGRRLSVTTLLIKIVAEALRQYPRANTSFESGRLRLYRDINIGVAMETEKGLIVPVVRGADHKSVRQINAEMKAFEEKASRMKFSGGDLEGGNFTITNLGMYGIDQFSAIVNPPQSSILAVGRIINTPVGTDEGAIVLKQLMTLTLSVDHRCMDGVQGARFLTLIRKMIEKPEIFMTGEANAS